MKKPARRSPSTQQTPRQPRPAIPAGTDDPEGIKRKILLQEQDCQPLWVVQTTKSLRKPPGIHIEERAGFKVPVCTAEYGANATAAFIRWSRPLLASETQQARVVLSKANPAGSESLVTLIKQEDFPVLNYLCTDSDIEKYVICHQRDLTPLNAANEILQGLFPGYSEKSISRMGRAMTQSHKQKNRTKSP